MSTTLVVLTNLLLRQSSVKPKGLSKANERQYYVRIEPEIAFVLSKDLPARDGRIL
jgi:2-keto-4-pentenoate hydratase